MSIKTPFETKNHELFRKSHSNAVALWHLINVVEPDSPNFAFLHYTAPETHADLFDSLQVSDPNFIATARVRGGCAPALDDTAVMLSMIGIPVFQRGTLRAMVRDALIDFKRS